MEKIFIHKNGIITKKDKPVNVPILKLLGNVIAIDEDFTLASFFKMVENYPRINAITDLLEPLTQIVSTAPATEYKADEIQSLIFYKTIEVKGFPGKPALNIYNTLKGRNLDETMNLKFFHIETLINHQLTLGQLNHIVFGDTEDIFRYETFYTLFELVEGITWELSFNFNPLQCSIRR